MTKFTSHILVKLSILIAINLLLALALFATNASAETKLISKGGILYPKTGDSTQAIYRLPKKARDVLRPGDLLGVLPENCSSASGPEGNYYVCHYGIYLQPYFYGDKLAYAVLKIE
jgi:hypothetical protein